MVRIAIRHQDHLTLNSPTQPSCVSRKNRYDMQRHRTSAPPAPPAPLATRAESQLLTQHETRRVFEALEDFFAGALKSQEPSSTALFLEKIVSRLRAGGLEIPHTVQTPYVTTIPLEQQPPYPGDWQTEVRLKSYVRWNAMAMVVRANSNTSVALEAKVEICPPTLVFEFARTTIAIAFQRT